MLLLKFPKSIIAEIMGLKKKKEVENSDNEVNGNFELSKSERLFTEIIVYLEDLMKPKSMKEYVINDLKQDLDALKCLASL